MKRMKTFFSDFKKFITKGNVIDLAVAVIIGAAFGKIVTSLVNDILMPLVTIALGAQSLSDLAWTLRDAVIVDGVVVKEALTVRWGSFLQNIIDFLIIAFVIFAIIRLLTAAKKAADKLNESAKELLEKATRSERVPSDTDAPSVTDIEEPASAPVPVTAASADEDKYKNIEELLREIRDLLKK